MWELSKEFWFDAAHTLNRKIDMPASERIHGHSYRARITVSGKPCPESGMIIDLGQLARSIEDIRPRLDHQFLDRLDDLGPATIENLCQWIWRALEKSTPSLRAVSVFRDSSGDACSYYGGET